MKSSTEVKTLFTKIDTVLLRVRRLEDARTWYEETLGFRTGYEDAKERLVVFNVGGETSLTLWEWKPGERRGEGEDARAYPIFFPRDLDSVHRHLVDRGVKVGAIEGDGHGTRWFGFRDPEGNRLEVCTYPQKGQGA